MAVSHEEFLRAIQAQPDEDLPRLIYADWLEEQGNPRGEFIRVQCELIRKELKNKRRRELTRRQSELLQQDVCLSEEILVSSQQYFLPCLHNSHDDEYIEHYGTKVTLTRVLQADLTGRIELRFHTWKERTETRPKESVLFSSWNELKNSIQTNLHAGLTHVSSVVLHADFIHDYQVYWDLKGGVLYNLIPDCSLLQILKELTLEGALSQLDPSVTAEILQATPSLQSFRMNQTDFASFVTEDGACFSSKNGAQLQEVTIVLAEENRLDAFDACGEETFLASVKASVGKLRIYGLNREEFLEECRVGLLTALELPHNSSDDKIFKGLQKFHIFVN